MIQGILPNGISLINVQAWIDGLGVADRKTKLVPTRTDITVSTPIYNGNILTFNGTSSKIEVGNLGNIKTVMFWVNPTTASEYPVDMNGTASIGILSNIVTATGWTSPTIYVNRAETSAIKTGVWSLVTVTSDTAIDASAVVVGLIGSDYLEGSLTNMIFLDKDVNATQVGQFYNKFEKGTVWNEVAETWEPNLTFLKIYDDLPTGTVTASQLDADFAVGSATATFTRTTSASAPATYVDDNGVIQLVTTSDLGRIRGGYYDATGFHAQKGLMIEGAGTNLSLDSYFSETITDYWGTFGATLTQDSGQLPPYGTNCAKIVASNIADRMFSAAGKRQATTSGSVYTFSAWMKGSGDVYLYVDQTTDAFSSKITLTSNWSRYSFTFTADLTASVPSGIQLKEAQAVTCYATGFQFEASPYATSFIPTTTAALTRNEETLKYAIAGNRTAASESIFVKFSPMGSFANDGVARFILDSDADRVSIYKTTTGTSALFTPNETDNTGVGSLATTAFASGTSYVLGSVAYGATSDVNDAIYTNGVSQDTDSTNYTQPDNAGTSFYLGSVNSSVSTTAQRLNGIIQSCAFFSDAKSTTDVASITNLLNQ